jgi:ABC-type nitrate/sulfonate/bicarbonate transport system ATPase subunit
VLGRKEQNPSAIVMVSHDIKEVAFMADSYNETTEVISLQ